MAALTLFLCLAGAAAPAPFPRRPAPSPLPCGACLMLWRGTPYLARFGPGGEYSARTPGGGGFRYFGTWRLDGPTLTVRERAEGSGVWREYRFPLARPEGDAILRGPDIELRPLGEK